MTRPEEIVAAARAMIGTPFVHQGRLPGAGLDCLGVVVCAAARCGVVLRDVTNYRRSPRPAQLLQELSEQLDRVGLDEVRPGDIGVFWVLRPGFEQHVGVIVDRDGESIVPLTRGSNGRMGVDARLGIVHALADLGRVAEHIFAGLWLERLARVYRFRGSAV